jgi:hypothetical protein
MECVKKQHQRMKNKNMITQMHKTCNEMTGTLDHLPHSRAPELDSEND